MYVKEYNTERVFELGNFPADTFNVRTPISENALFLSCLPPLATKVDF